MTPGLEELIERLESAAGMDRALDDAIAQYLGSTFIRDKFSTGTWLFGPAPQFTSDFNVALRIKPDNCTWAAGDCNEDNECWACITPHTEPCPDYYGEGATEAIALCIAALKARQQAGKEME